MTRPAPALRTGASFVTARQSTSWAAQLGLVAPALGAVLTLAARGGPGGSAPT